MQGQSSCEEYSPVVYQWFSLYAKGLRKVKVHAQNLPMYYIGVM